MLGKIGKWEIIKTAQGGEKTHCSNCQEELLSEVRYAIGLPNYCPNCGAMMHHAEKQSGELESMVKGYFEHLALLNKIIKESNEDG